MAKMLPLEGAAKALLARARTSAMVSEERQGRVLVEAESGSPVAVELLEAVLPVLRDNIEMESCRGVAT